MYSVAIATKIAILELDYYHFLFLEEIVRLNPKIDMLMEEYQYQPVLVSDITQFLFSIHAYGVVSLSNIYYRLSKHPFRIISIIQGLNENGVAVDSFKINVDLFRWLKEESPSYIHAELKKELSRFYLKPVDTPATRTTRRTRISVR